MKDEKNKTVLIDLYFPTKARNPIFCKRTKYLQCYFSLHPAYSIINTRLQWAFVFPHIIQFVRYAKCESCESMAIVNSKCANRTGKAFDEMAWRRKTAKSNRIQCFEEKKCLLVSLVPNSSLGVTQGKASFYRMIWNQVRVAQRMRIIKEYCIDKRRHDAMLGY